MCGCAPCLTPVPDTATPTATGGSATPTATPTSAESVSLWTVDNYEVASSDCAGVIEDAIVSALRAGGSDFTVRQSGEHVEIEDGDGNAFEGTADADGTVGVQRTVSGSIGPGHYKAGVDASANLSNSSTTATYDGTVHLSGLCSGLSDCSLQISSRWTRLEADRLRHAVANASAVGIRKEKTAPRSRFASAHRRPRWASMIERLIASPSPMPCGLVV